MAAVQRSLATADEPITRRYLLQVERRIPAGNTFVFDNDLYVQGSNRWALRHPGLLPRKSFWLGRDGADAWILPAFGPVRKGDDTLVSRWLRSHEEMNTPYLHVKTLLARMSRGYRLEMLDDTEITLSDGRAVMCQHIRARLRTSAQVKLPETIELWTLRESGMAARLTAQWNLPKGKTGLKSITLAFQDEEPSLPDNWFTAEAHYKGRKPMK